MQRSSRPARWLPLAAVPGLVLGFLALSARLSASVPAWQVDAQERIVWLGSETDLAPVLVPFVVAGGSLAVFALLGSGRRFLAIPVAAGIVGALVGGALAPGAAIPAAVFAVVGAGALALAATRAPTVVRGLLPVLATLGIGGSGLAVSAGYSNAATWPWAIAAVLATAVAGRVLARRVWSATSAVGVGAAHLTVAVVLASIAFATIPAWLAESAAPLPAPWDSGWLWLGVLGAVLLAVVVLMPRRSDADRIAMVVPALAAAMVGALVTAFADGTDLSWLPAAISAVVVVGALRTSSPALVSTLLAAAGPILVAVALDRGLAAIPGAPPAILGAAAGVLLAAAIAPLVLPRANRSARVAWVVSIGVAGLATLAWIDAASDQRWLLLLLLVPVPVLVASLDGDPIGGSAPSRHLSWLSLPLARRRGLDVAPRRRRRRHRGLRAPARGHADRRRAAAHLASTHRGAVRRRPHGPVRVGGRDRRAAERRLQCRVRAPHAHPRRGRCRRRARGIVPARGRARSSRAPPRGRHRVGRTHRRGARARIRRSPSASPTRCRSNCGRCWRSSRARPSPSSGRARARGRTSSPRACSPPRSWRRRCRR